MLFGCTIINGGSPDHRMAANLAPIIPMRRYKFARPGPKAQSQLVCILHWNQQCACFGNVTCAIQRLLSLQVYIGTSQKQVLAYRDGELLATIQLDGMPARLGLVAGDRSDAIAVVLECGLVEMYSTGNGTGVDWRAAIIR
jgi:hypothetical protein